MTQTTNAAYELYVIPELGRVDGYAMVNHLEEMGLVNRAKAAEKLAYGWFANPDTFPEELKAYPGLHLLGTIYSDDYVQWIGWDEERDMVMMSSVELRHTSNSSRIPVLLAPTES